MTLLWWHPFLPGASRECRPTPTPPPPFRALPPVMENGDFWPNPPARAAPFPTLITILPSRQPPRVPAVPPVPGPSLRLLPVHPRPPQRGWGCGRGPRAGGSGAGPARSERGGGAAAPAPAGGMGMSALRSGSIVADEGIPRRDYC